MSASILPDTAARIEEIRQRNAYRLERRRINENAGLVSRRRNHRKQRTPSATEDVQWLLSVIDQLVKRG